jgi:phosphatidylserine decarboxylase
MPADTPPPAIHYVDRASRQVREEKVYGGTAVKFLYQTGPGFLAERAILSRRPLSVLYGLYNDTKLSAVRIPTFIKDFAVNMAEYVEPTGGFSSFNDFFTRKFKTGARWFPAEGKKLGSPAEGRVLAFKNLTADTALPVKGGGVKLARLLGSEALARRYTGGTGYIIRLCPVDYHRYHFPDGGVAAAPITLSGAFHSVNPWALARMPGLLAENERVLTILQSENFGELALLEVAAMMVGRMVQTFTPGTKVSRGEEKGYFLFGGSTTILLAEPGRLTPSADLLENSAKGLETLVKLGEPLGERP